MGVSVPDLLIDLIKTASVVVIFAYLVTRTDFPPDLLEKKPKLRSRVMAVLALGALSIFGTYGGSF